MPVEDKFGPSGKRGIWGMIFTEIQFTNVIVVKQNGIASIDQDITMYGMAFNISANGMKEHNGIAPGLPGTPVKRSLIWGWESQHQKSGHFPKKMSAKSIRLIHLFFNKCHDLSTGTIHKLNDILTSCNS